MEHLQERALLAGNVEVSSETAVLNADTMEIFYQGELEDIIHIRAVGSVEFKHDRWQARGNRADYYLDADTGVLKGNAYVREGDNELWGEQVWFDGPANRLKVVEGVRGSLKPRKESEVDN